MGTNDLSIQLFDTPAEAPIYRPGEHQRANLLRACVVGAGTVNGNPTVDLIFEDAHGKQYVAMTTGAILEGLAAAVRGVRERTKT